MPKPRKGESRKDFVDRCIPIVIDEGTADDGAAAAAICHSIYDRKDSSAMESGRKLYSFSLKTQAKNGIHFEHIGEVEYMVVSAVAVMETVLNGFLIPAKEIDHFPEAWNGTPVPVGHPQSDWGWPVSARTHDQLFRTAGWFFNVEVDREDGHKLLGEIWIDIKRAIELGGDVERAYSQIRNGYESEVSSAFFADIEDTSGTFDGVEYSGIFRHIIPDHVAILLDELGACNREDGCGTPQPNSTDGQDVTLHTNEHKENNMDRNSIITALIACDCCELDRDALEAMDDDTLVAMAGMRDNFARIRGELNEQISANADTGDSGGDDDVGSDGEATDSTPVDNADLATFIDVLGEFGGIEQFVQTLRTAHENAQSGNAQAERERDEIITRIVGNSTLQADMLTELTLEALTALDADLLPVNYSGRAIRDQANAGQSTRMPMPSVMDDDDDK